MITDPSRLAAQVASLKGARVLCVGDVMLDRFVYGEVNRISPEAPIPVVRVVRESAMLGGAGNVVRNLGALNVKAHFLAAIGADSAGQEIARLIGAQDGVEPFLMVNNSRQTTIKTRFFAGGQQMLRVDNETSEPLDEPSQAQIVSSFASLVGSAGAVALSDYDKGVLAPPLLADLIGKAVAAKLPVVVDPKGSNYSPYRGATLVTPNRKELREATRMPVTTSEDIVVAAKSVIAEAGIANVLVTRSQDGMTLVTATGEVHHLPAQAREVFDVSGAGDTVVAVMAAALAAGLPILDAAYLANIAAGIVVGKVGTAVATADEIVATLHQTDLAAGEAKVASLDSAIDLIDRWRHKGLTIGFTNGCFDLLHPGHVSLLAQARAQCDRLVVGLNSDQSVQRLKGPTRPVQSEAARAAVLASLASVDLVVLFEEDTPLKLISALRPHILVKGADYTIDTVVGADLVQGWGGKIVLADLMPGHSTTATIARMAR